MPGQGQPGEGWGLPRAGWVMPRWVMPSGMSGWGEWVPSFPAAPEHFPGGDQAVLSRCRQEQHSSSARLLFSPAPLVSPESSISMPSGVFANQ